MPVHQTHNIESFAEIIREHRDQIYNVCLGMMKNREDAEDVAQEVFISAFQKLETFDQKAKVSTWLYRIAVNKCLETERRAGRQKRSADFLELNEGIASAGSPFYHPGVQLENRERSAILFAAIEQLPESQRVAFTLQQVEGLGQEEIGHIMNRSSSSVESLLHRARTHLRKTLRKYYEAHG